MCVRELYNNPMFYNTKKQLKMCSGSLNLKGLQTLDRRKIWDYRLPYLLSYLIDLNPMPYYYNW